MTASSAADQAHDVVIVSCFSEGIYQRPYMVARYFREAGYHPVILTMGFSHVHKRPITRQEEGSLYVPVPAYRKNISLRRIYSHLVFSRQAAKRLLRMKPRVIYICCPPNSAAYYGSKSAQRIGATLIVDVLDVWPEAMPFPPKLKWLLNHTIGPAWRAMRNRAMQRADYCLSESASMVDLLGEARKHCQVVYLSRDKKVIDKELMQVPDPLTLRIGYLGNINNIGDFESLVRVCGLIERYRVQVDVIGEGERRAWLLAALNTLGIATTYHGVVYDEEKKQEVLSACDFGFNGYKQETVVSLSYKSVEYFSKGVPLLNSARPDTWEIVNEWKAGLNYEQDDVEALAAAINALSREELWQMRLRARQVYDTLFAFAPYREKMDRILAEVLDKSIERG